MVGDATCGFSEIVVGFVDGLLGGISGLHCDVCRAMGEFAQVGGVIGVIGDKLCLDVLGALERVLRRAKPSGRVT